MSRLFLTDEGVPFEVTRIEVAEPSRVVLFAVGAGGNPERHLPLLTSLADQGCTVVAPHFDRLTTPRPTDADLLLRARRLRIALDLALAASPDRPVAGVGHSIGATTLIALAGGTIWMAPGHALAIAPDERLERLALLTPATAFFRAPGALEHVHTPLLVWAGTNDVMTPPAHAELLKESVGERVAVDLRIVRDAGHFSFMNTLPPQVVEPLASAARDALLADLARDIGRFVCG